MQLLIIGGSRFMGYAATEYAVSRGHKVTLFNRGQSNPKAFTSVEHLTGDRETGLDALKGRQWDAVLDTCGYYPRIVKLSTDLLKPNVGHYTFISSVSVYEEKPDGGPDESSEVQTLKDPTVETINGETYGGLKVLCEKVIQDAFGDEALIVRPGLIVGPRDPTFRFNYLVKRMAHGGEVLVPGLPDSPVQFIDGRDLGEWIVRQIEAKTAGVFNATGPAKHLSMGEFLQECQQVFQNDSSLTWVDEPFLADHGITLWAEIPLCLPADEQYFQAAHIDKALSAGLTFRPLADTLKASHAWLASHPAANDPQGTLTLEREGELLRDWHTKK